MCHIEDILYIYNKAMVWEKPLLYIDHSLCQYIQYLLRCVVQPQRLTSWWRQLDSSSRGT